MLIATAVRSFLVITTFSSACSMNRVRWLACKLGASASTLAIVSPFLLIATEHTGVAVSICKMYVFSIINIMEQGRAHALPKDGISKFVEQPDIHLLKAHILGSLPYHIVNR